MSVRAQTVTQVLMRQGHYFDPEGEHGRDSGGIVEWMIADAESILSAPRTFDGIAEAMEYVGLHDPEECNEVCVSIVCEALGIYPCQSSGK
jgi:hypothetical protein